MAGVIVTPAIPILRGVRKENTNKVPFAQPASITRGDGIFWKVNQASVASHSTCKLPIHLPDMGVSDAGSVPACWASWGLQG